MSIIAEPSDAALVVVYRTGIGTGGASITRQRTIGNINYNASVEAAYEAAHAIFSLSEYSVVDVYLRKTDELINEE